MNNGASDEKNCFVISEIGEPGTETRKRADTLLDIIKRALLPLGYKAIRADEIDSPDMITHNISEYLFKSPLAIADLTNLNPNVFYELGARHTFEQRLPVIHIAEKGTKLPFDVDKLNVIFYDLNSIVSVFEASDRIVKFIDNIKSNEKKLDNPLNQSLHQMRTSITPEIAKHEHQWLLDMLERKKPIIVSGEALKKYEGNYYAYYYSAWAFHREEMGKPILRSAIDISLKDNHLWINDHGVDEDSYSGGVIHFAEEMIVVRASSEIKETDIWMLFKSTVKNVKIIYGIELCYHGEGSCLRMRPIVLQRIPESEEIVMEGNFNLDEVTDRIASLLVPLPTENMNTKFPFKDGERNFAYLELPKHKE